MTRSRTLVIASIMAFTLGSGCGSGGTDPDGGNNGGGGGGVSGTMTARIDGVAWTADRRIRVRQDPRGVYTIEGLNSASMPEQVTLGLFNIGATGTYPMGVGATIIGGLGIYASAAQQWSSPMDDSGTLVITEISATRIKGTFAFAANPVALGGATGLRNITDGHFDLPLSGTYHPPTDAQGSSMVMDTGTTQAMVAATIIGSYHDTTLIFSGQTSRFLTTISLKGVHGPGSSPSPPPIPGTRSWSGATSPPIPPICGVGTRPTPAP